MEAFAVEVAEDGDGGGPHQGIAVAAAGAGLGAAPPLEQEPVLQEAGRGRIQAAAQVPGVGVEIGLAEELVQPLADQGFVLAEQARGGRGLGRAAGGPARGGGLLLVEGGGLHHQGLHHQLHLLGGHGQLLEGPHQVILEALDPPGDAIGLAGEAALDLPSHLVAAALQLGHLLLEDLAFLLELPPDELQ